MSMLSDFEIRDWATGGGVSPYAPECVNPASIDLRWSGAYRRATPEGWTEAIDAATLVMKHGEFYLLDTMETIIMPDWAAGKLFLKSSVGRRGIEHLHAGYIDPGFIGTLTLEMETHVPWNTTIERGERLVQLTLEKMSQPPHDPYRSRGHYMHQTGPTLAWQTQPPQRAFETDIVAGAIYEHYKGGRYQVLSCATHTETEEPLVVYRAHDGDRVWVRPAEMFTQIVEVNGTHCPRFTRLTPREILARVA